MADKVVVAYSATVYVTVEQGRCGCWTVAGAKVNVHHSDATCFGDTQWVAEAPEGLDEENVKFALFASEHYDWPTPDKGTPSLEVMV